MHETIIVEGPIQRFPGKGGWSHVRLSETLSAELRPIVRSTWPALLPVEVTAGEVSWKASLMPIKDGPLFVVVPKKIRTKHRFEEGDRLHLSIRLLGRTTDAGLQGS